MHVYSEGGLLNSQWENDDDRKDHRGTLLLIMIIKEC